MKRFFLLAAFAWLGLVLTSLHAQAETLLDSEDSEYVWVEPYEMPNGDIVEGYWRKVDEYGQIWSEPFYEEDGQFVDAGWVEVPVPEGIDEVQWEPSRLGADGSIRDGYWRAAEREGYAWSDEGWEPSEYVEEDTVYVRGYVSHQNIWVPGFYRKRVRAGYIWVDGYYLGGVYHVGYWSPLSVPSGYTYVYGHVGPGGYWVPGFYRPTFYAGFAWTPGYYVGATWYWGCWTPVSPRTGYTYVAGHTHNGYWVNGYWRASVKTGHHWAPGYYKSGVYYKGKWKKGNVKVVKKTIHYAGAGARSSARTKVLYASAKRPERASATNRRFAERKGFKNSRGKKFKGKRALDLRERRSMPAQSTMRKSSRAVRPRDMTGVRASAKGVRSRAALTRPAGSLSEGQRLRRASGASSRSIGKTSSGWKESQRPRNLREGSRAVGSRKLEKAAKKNAKRKFQSEAPRRQKKLRGSGSGKSLKPGTSRRYESGTTPKAQRRKSLSPPRRAPKKKVRSGSGASRLKAQPRKVRPKSSSSFSPGARPKSAVGRSGKSQSSRPKVNRARKK